ncbi:class I SAM-dependent methyltransferase [Tepidamorphus sp. 3E244]|uniref:class I SAM-dependent methyltransferase n=1 Tax=Tepidamorphus sp. 3E244 TaxID=3385498 RepID=UPI0038FC6684
MADASAGQKGKDWDVRYRESAGALFGDAPNDYLRMVSAREGFAPVSALLIADGDGRNGTWLATRGLAVTALDLSEEATRLARARDAASGVTVERVCADVTIWTPQDRAWDAAFVFYLQGPSALRRAGVETARAALKPGGWLVLEGFASGGDLNIGPSTTAKRYDLAELRTWCEGLEIVELVSGEVLLDEGARHNGPAHVVRLLARRSA